MARYDVQGKVALITGGARGIGFATAEALAARGAKVVIVDLEQAACEDAAARISDTDALGLAADVTDRGALQRVVAQTTERFGGVDVVVANAGIANRTTTVRAQATETFDRVIDVNLNGVARTVQATIQQVADRGGHIVVVASVYAFMNSTGAGAYAMAKAGVEQLGRALRVELRPYGASASVAYFGFIDTEMVKRALDRDPLSDEMFATVPRPLRKRLKPSVAGEGIARGIERRKARIIHPRRWALVSTMRGIFNAIGDRMMLRHRPTQDLVRQLDSREDEEQPTTA